MRTSSRPCPLFLSCTQSFTLGCCYCLSVSFVGSHLTSFLGRLEPGSPAPFRAVTGQHLGTSTLLFSGTAVRDWPFTASAGFLMLADGWWMVCAPSHPTPLPAACSRYQGARLGRIIIWLAQSCSKCGCHLQQLGHIPRFIE